MGRVRWALLAAGIAAPLVYLATVVIGGWATPGYSHLEQPVSALNESGAPHAVAVSLAFVVYNLLVIAFGAGLFDAFRDEGPLLRVAAVMVALSGLFGLVLWPLPMDPMGAPFTVTGLAHIVVAAMLLFSTLLAMGTAAFGWWKGRRGAALATVAGLVAVVAAGALAANAATQQAPLLGLFQRLTIGTYLLWLFAVALWLLFGRGVRQR